MGFVLPLSLLLVQSNRRQVITGYILELALGAILSVAFLSLESSLSPLYQTLTSGLVVFFDSAVYFAMAVQLATIAVMVRKDYGISTADLGAIEVQIAHATAVISLLPLLYPTALLERLRDGGMKHNRRLVLLSVTAALSFYPFLSRCMHAYAKGPISNSADAKVQTKRWRHLEEMCFSDGLDGLRDNPVYKALDEISLASGLAIYLATLWLVAALPVARYRDTPKLRRRGGPTNGRLTAFRERTRRWFGTHKIVACLPLALMVAAGGLLLHVVFVLRDVQRSVAETTGQAYQGDHWGFGQIAAIVLFLPVGVEMAYERRFQGRYLAG